MLVKDEADVLGFTLDHLSRQVDGIIVADNGSTDGSREIAEAFGVLLVDDPEVAYYQAAKTTRLARRARELGYDWVVPCDADEVWTSPHHPTVSAALAELDATYAYATAELYDHLPTSADSKDVNPFRRIGYRKRERAGLPKVACRARPDLEIGQGNHSAQPPGRVAEWYLSIRHFAWRSPEQFVRKSVNGARAYAAADLPPHMGEHWRSYGAMIEKWGEEAGHDWFRLHFYYPQPESEPSLIYDPFAP